MRKLFTLIAMALVAIGASASTVGDLPVAKSCVINANDYTVDGTNARVKGTIFGEYVLDLKGGSIATNKGKQNPAAYADLAEKYPADQYPVALNSLRLKNTQDMIAINVVAGTKITILFSGNNKSGTSARYPKFSKNADLSDALNPAPTADHAVTGNCEESITVDEDMILYIGSYNGDMFLSYIIIEAPEAEPAPEPVTVNVDFSQFDYAAGSMSTATPVTEDNGFSFVGNNAKVTLNKSGFYLGGSSGSTYRYVSFTPQYDGTLTATAFASGNNTDRFVAIADAAKTPAKDGSDVLAFTMMPTKGSVVTVSYDLTAGTTYYVLLYGNGTINSLSYTYTPSATKDEIVAFHDWFLQCATTLNQREEFVQRDLAAEYEATAQGIVRDYKAGAYEGKEQLAKDALAQAFLDLFKGTSLEAVAKMFVNEKMNEGNHTATAISNVETSAPRAGKFIQNGRVVIVKNGKTYSTTGALLK